MHHGIAPSEQTDKHMEAFPSLVLRRWSVKIVLPSLSVNSFHGRTGFYNLASVVDKIHGNAMLIVVATF